VYLLKRVLQVIEQDRLIERTREAGAALLRYIKKLEKSYPEIVSNARGVGTLCAIDFPDTDTRNKIIDHLWSNGLAAQGSGERTLRFRPALIYTTSHAELTYDIMDDVLNKYRSDGVVSSF